MNLNTPKISTLHSPCQHQAARAAIARYRARAPRFKADNIEAARIIAADLVRYEGLLQTRAAKVLAREAERRAA